MEISIIESHGCNLNIINLNFLRCYGFEIVQNIYLSFLCTKSLKTTVFSAATPVVRTNIYSAAGGDVCRLQFLISITFIFKYVMNLQFYSTSTLRFNAQKAWRQAVKTNIYSAAGVMFVDCSLRNWSAVSGCCGTAATTRNPCLLGQGAVTLVTLGHFRHLVQPFVQVSPSSRSLSSPWSNLFPLNLSQSSS